MTTAAQEFHFLEEGGNAIDILCPIVDVQAFLSAASEIMAAYSDQINKAQHAIEQSLKEA